MAFAALVLLAFLTGYPQVAALAAGCLVALVLARATTPAPLLELRPEWATPRLVEDSMTSLVVQVSNPTRRRSAPTMLNAELKGADGAVTVLTQAAPALRARSSQTIRLDTPQLPRGLYRVSAVVGACSDVLGLFHRRRPWACALTLTVHPRTVDLRSGRRRGAADPDAGQVLGPRRPGETFHALRDYQPGDDVRLIHWSATARTGNPVVRDLIRADVVRQAVVLDTADPARAARSFDTAVQVAGSLALAAVAAGETWLLSTSGLREHYQPGGSRDDVLDPLAAVTGGDRAATGPRLPKEATSVTVITGPEPDERRWRALAGPRDLAIVSITDVASTSSRRGVRMLAVSTLDDLAPNLRVGRR